MKLSLLFALAGWLVVFNSARSAETAAPPVAVKPNIHFILADDQKWNTLGCIGKWINNADEGTKFYAGTATYRTTFDLLASALVASEEKSFLDLGKAYDFATLQLNGQSLGSILGAQWQVDISSSVKAGQNSLHVPVVNPWNNCLVGDVELSVEHRRTSLSLQTVKPDAPLLSAVLHGPVMVQTVVCVK